MRFAFAISRSVTPPHYAFRIAWKTTCILPSGWELLPLAVSLYLCIRLAESGENHHSFLICGFYESDLHLFNPVYRDSAFFLSFKIFINKPESLAHINLSTPSESLLANNPTRLSS